METDTKTYSPTIMLSEKNKKESLRRTRASKAIPSFRSGKIANFTQEDGKNFRMRPRNLNTLRSDANDRLLRYRFGKNNMKNFIETKKKLRP